MRAIAVGVIGVSGLALAACMPKATYGGVDVMAGGHGPLRAAAALDCPVKEGSLTRTAQAADGQSCDYEGPVGETVRLRLVRLDGRTPVEAMAPTKAGLKALIPLDVRSVPGVEKDEPGERTNIDLPFFHVHAAGEHADVKLLGLKVHTEGDKAEVRTNHGRKNTVVRANRDGAEVVAENVGRTKADLIYVLSAETPAASGYRAVGYIARGPATGPLVAAEFRVTGEPRGEGDHGDLSRLVERSVRR